MRLGDLLFFAIGALRGHRLRSGLSLLGVAIGVSSVLILTSLGEGARLFVTGEFASLGSNLLIIVPGKIETTGGAPVTGGVPHDLTLDDLEVVRRRVPRVRRIAPLTIGTAPVRVEDRTRDAIVIGTTHEMAAIRKIRVAVGSYLPAGEAERWARVCVLGPKLAAELFRGANPLGETVRIGEERFRVIGLLAPRGISLGMDFDEIVAIPVARGLRLFNRTSLFRTFAEVASHEEIPAARREVLKVLTERHAGEEDVTVLTQDAVISTFGRILSILTAALAGIAAVSLTVAGVGIMNVMLVSVSERTREIGLLKALGVSENGVLRAFLVEAALLSCAGGLLGLLTGFGAARVVRALYPSFPAQPPVWAVVFAAAVSLSVGLLFGALPARRAARLDPIAALARR